MFRETPAGRERERLTGLIRDHHDQGQARDTLIVAVGTRRFAEADRAKRSNGGGPVDIRDLCAELTVTDLTGVCRELGIR